jgi:hypothetical protein
VPHYWVIPEPTIPVAPVPDPPRAIFTVVPEPASVDELVTFDMRSSTPGPWYDLDRIEWDFHRPGGGIDRVLREPVVERTYSQVGNFWVVLVIRDREGRADTAAGQVHILPTMPAPPELEP